MSRRYLRPGVLVGHVLVLAASLTCLRLGWWQWDVARASYGTVQNLGYAFLWPVFAGTFIYMWLRFLHLESVRDAEPDEPVAPTGARDEAAIPGLAADAVPVTDVDPRGAAAPSPALSSIPTADPAPPIDGDGVVPEPATRRDRLARGRKAPAEVHILSVATVGDDDDDDPELAAYNKALAALAEQDERRAH